MKRLISLLILTVAVFTLSACKDQVTFELIGDENVLFVTGEEYVEYGFIARSNQTDLSEYVTIDYGYYEYEAGDYSVVYTLDYKGTQQTLTRNVYYRERGCSPVLDTNLTMCETRWTMYLHTTVRLVTYYEDDTYHDAMVHVFDNVENILDTYHRLSTKYDDYGINNVYAINQDPTTTHELDPRLFELIQFSLNHQDEVNNLFNIALGPVLKVWHDAREACNDFSNPVCAAPELSALQAADQYTNPSNIVLDEDNHTITMGPNMSIDLGGVSKGFISGKIIEYLDNLGLSYLLNSGTSNISIGGTHPTRENGKFLLAVTDPSSTSGWYAEVFLGDGDQLVTSGDYQQYFEVEEDWYHHIINPNTLYPERYSRSVSIITSDPALADLYSTAIFTMTIEDGLTFVNGIDNLEAIWYTLDNTVVMSDQFETLYVNELYVPIAE